MGPVGFMGCHRGHGTMGKSRRWLGAVGVGGGCGGLCRAMGGGAYGSQGAVAVRKGVCVGLWPMMPTADLPGAS